ncbi:hypothetical protein DFH06DRAFT_1474330 [Mycena polygramma]|nr:hypothetical protein DFH06DRAFT_1474330 [Mycena polygramma]
MLCHSPSTLTFVPLPTRCVAWSTESSLHLPIVSATPSHSILTSILSIHFLLAVVHRPPCRSPFSSPPSSPLSIVLLAAAIVLAAIVLAAISPPPSSSLLTLVVVAVPCPSPPPSQPPLIFPPSTLAVLPLLLAIILSSSSSLLAALAVALTLFARRCRRRRYSPVLVAVADSLSSGLQDLSGKLFKISSRIKASRLKISRYLKTLQGQDYQQPQRLELSNSPRTTCPILSLLPASPPPIVLTLLPARHYLSFSLSLFSASSPLLLVV